MIIAQFKVFFIEGRTSMTEVFEYSDEIKSCWPNPPTFEQFMSLDGEIFRQVARRRTLKFQCGQKPYFIKIHQGVGWGEIFKNLLQLRLPVLGAKNEYEAIHRMQQLGIETMTLVAYGCRGWNPAEQDSFVVTKSLENTISLEDYCRDWKTSPPAIRVKRLLIQRIAEMAGSLHRNGLNHRDLYICHFLLQLDEEGQYDPENPLHLYLIDLHRVQIRKITPERWLVKDVAALYFSSDNCGLTQKDLFRFIKIYSGRPLRECLHQNGGFWNKVEKRAQALWKKHA